MADDGLDIRSTWSSSDRRIPRAIVRPLQEFLQTSTASAFLLFGAVVVAIVWANSPWGDTYEQFWSASAKVQIGTYTLGKDLHFWVNDGLMTIFFLLVGIEIKRELTTGELQQPRAAILPAVAAVGGMVVPAALFLAVAGGSEGSGGWGIPMATDIALALGALALAAAHAPAIVDDIGAILVIALFYSSGGNPVALAAAFALLLAMVGMQRVHVRSTIPYIVVGAAVWLATYEAGVHPTIAGVAIGLLTPAEPFQRPSAVSDAAKQTAEETVDAPEPPDSDAPAWLRLASLSKEAVSPLARVEHALLPWSSWVIVPIFALANAGIEVGGRAVVDAMRSPVALGILLGLVLGKPIGVLLGSWSVVRSGAAGLPRGVGWGDLAGTGATAGIGFTVALFIAELAFSGDHQLLAEAKVGILVASGIAGVIGYSLLRVFPSPPAAVDAAGDGEVP
jgi:NhaA family Na+:H+ antiporter